MSDIINQLLSSNLTQIVILLVVFVAVVAAFFSVLYLLSSKRNIVQERLQRTVTRSSASSLEGGVFDDTSSASGEGSTLLHQVLDSFTRLSRPTDDKELGRLRTSLRQAGFQGERAMLSYLTIKLMLCFGLGGMVLWYNTVRPQPLPYAAFFTLLLMTLGLYLPNFWLHGRVTERKSKINKTLPDALDLIVTCVEAGLGLDAALNRVSQEIAPSAPILSKELAQAALEMRTGVGRGEAFRRLARRTGVEELHSLAAIIIQTEMFGTSVAKSLRIQAEGMRVRRTQLAEERAAIVGVKLTIPLILCILPSHFAVLMGPAVVKIFKVLLPSLGGGG